MLANTPAMLECHYGVPMTQGVLNTLNTRLDAPIIAFSLDHADAKVVITDREFSKVMKEALAPLQGEAAGDRLRRPGISPAPASGSAKSNTRSSSRRAIRDYAWNMPDDEWDAITLNYTSRHHRRSQGRRLSPPRRVSARGRQRRHLLHGQASGLSVDAADVPLQRLVLPVVDLGRRRHACVPARGARAPRCTTRSPATR